MSRPLAIKSKLHVRNRNREPYDLSALTALTPELKPYIIANKYGEASVNFSHPQAIKLLNTSILKHYYGVHYWTFSDDNLCPPIPGRADYIHHIADLLAASNFGVLPEGKQVTCFDLGVGASCIYPILGVVDYDWNFIASDISPASIASSQAIVDANKCLKGKVDCRLQKRAQDYFYGVLNREESVDMVICNPPFHSSVEEAEKGNRRKVKHLTGKSAEEVLLNFAGIHNELVCDGGERQFIHNMMKESAKFSKNSFWFSTLVSKKSHLKGIYKRLETMSVTRVETIPMGTGNKSSRMLAWTFLTELEQLAWRASRWQ